jgi:hypothetical protein
MVLLRQGKTGDAMAALTEARRRAPDSPLNRYWIGRVSSRRQSRLPSRPQGGNPSRWPDAATCASLAEALHKLGRDAEARWELDRAVGFGKKAPKTSRPR